MGAALPRLGSRTLRWGALSAGVAGAVLAASAAPPAPAYKPPLTAAAPTHGCLIEPDRIAEIGSQVVGLVERVHADRGDHVKSGQALIELRAEVERANMGVADARSRIDADVRAASTSLELAEQKVQRAQTLVGESFVSQQALDQALAERELASQKLAQTRGQLRVLQEEKRVAEAQLRLRTVRSPLSGIIVERYVNQGERVEDRPLMRVAVVDPLRVELMVPTSQYGSFKQGDSIMVQPELPGAPPMRAKVALIDLAMDAASNSFRMRLSLANLCGQLPSGLRCKADLAGARLEPAPASASGYAPAVWRHDAAAVLPPPGARVRPVEGVASTLPAAAKFAARPAGAARAAPGPSPLGVGVPLALRLDRTL